MNMLPLIFAARKKKYKNLSSSERMRTVFPLMYLPERSAMIGAVAGADQLKRHNNTKKELSITKAERDLLSKPIKIEIPQDITPGQYQISIGDYTPDKVVWKPSSISELEITAEGKIDSKANLCTVGETLETVAIVEGKAAHKIIFKIV